MRSPHVLCLLGKSPLPPVTGSRVRIKRLIEGLSELGLMTVVVAGNVSDDERRRLEAWNVGRVVLAPTPPRRPSVLERTQWASGLGPERTWLYRTHAPVVEILRAELGRSPDVLWTSGRGAARLLEGLQLPPLVVDVQGPERLALLREISVAVRRLRPSTAPRLAQLVLDAPGRVKAERLLWSRASLITPVSREDASLIPARWASKVRVVPNGVDIPAPVTVDPNSQRIVFLGNMNYGPNADAAQWIVDKILPRILASRPNAELRLVGIAPEGLRSSLTSPKVTFTGFAEDIRTAFNDASAALLALRSGAGTKLKVLEALAHGVPVVTTPIGNEGIGTVDEEHLLVRESAEDLADSVVRLLSDRELASRLAQNGREFVSRTHGWPHAVAELRAGIETVVSDHRPSEGNL